MTEGASLDRVDVLIVGAGHAGAQAAIALRQRGHPGSIMLVGDEPDRPYERPPLSKDYLAGDREAERLALRPDAFWATRHVAVRTGTRIAAIDAHGRIATTGDGARIGYDSCIWATGGTARALPVPGADLGGIHAIRTRAGVDALRADLAAIVDDRGGGPVAVGIVGGGYIGLEAAAVLRGQGHAVTVIETADRLLARVTSPELSAFYADQHRERGVDIRLGATVTALSPAPARPDRVGVIQLADGGTIPVDIVIVGIGIVPAVAPLLAAGAAGSAQRGVDVDPLCRTTLPGVLAIGDCAAQVSAFAAGGAMTPEDRRVRIESVQNATDQAGCAVRTIMGDPRAYRATPWFWSNQYDLRLQSVGLSAGRDRSVVRGDPASRSFSVVHLADGRVIALDCVNQTRDYIQGRALVEARAAIAPDRLADVGTPLKAMLGPDGVSA